MIPRAFGPVITEIPPRDEVLRRRSPFEGFHSSESVQHPAFYRCRESYPRRNGSPRNCCSRAGDRAYGQTFQRRIRVMGIRDRPISPRSPWQNPYAERLIGTLRRECLDHVLIVGERHLPANAGLIFVLLQRVAHALGVGEGCAVTASYPELRSDHHHANSFRTASSLCADMIFGKDNPMPSFLSGRLCRSP
jgi:hypothetical protein